MKLMRPTLSVRPALARPLPNKCKIEKYISNPFRCSMTIVENIMRICVVAGFLVIFFDVMRPDKVSAYANDYKPNDCTVSTHH